MKGTLVQSTTLSAAVFSLNHGKLGESEKNRTAKMISNFQLPHLQAPALLPSNAFNTLAMPQRRRGRGRGRGSCCVAKARMEDHFTNNAIKAMMLAQEEARRLAHTYVGTEQILLGLIGEGSGTAAKVLISMGINLKDTRMRVEKIIGRGYGFVPLEIPLTPAAMCAMQQSVAEMKQRGHRYVGSGHLLLGLLHEGEGVACRVLDNLDVDFNYLREEILEDIKLG